MNVARQGRPRKRTGWYQSSVLQGITDEVGYVGTEHPRKSADEGWGSDQLKKLALPVRRPTRLAPYWLPPEDELMTMSSSLSSS